MECSDRILQVDPVAVRCYAPGFHQTCTPTEGWQKFLHRIKDEPPTLVLCEATGGYEKNVVIALAEAEVPFRVVNAARVRDYVKSLGILAKTNKIDAKVLAQFAAERILKSLIVWRRQLIKTRTIIGTNSSMLLTRPSGLAGKMSKEKTEPGAVAPELPLRAL